MRRWFRIGDGNWHLLVIRSRCSEGRRWTGAACSPTFLRPRHGRPDLRRVLTRSKRPPETPCANCARVWRGWPKPVPRPWSVRRTVCGRDCGAWLPRDPDPELPVPCGGYHRNKRLFCEADAKWAITSTGRGRIRWDDNLATTFFRCTACAGIYRMDPEWFTCERLMSNPPKELVA